MPNNYKCCVSTAQVEKLNVTNIPRSPSDHISSPSHAGENSLLTNSNHILIFSPKYPSENNMV